MILMIFVIKRIKVVCATSFQNPFFKTILAGTKTKKQAMVV